MEVADVPAEVGIEVGLGADPELGRRVRHIARISSRPDLGSILEDPERRSGTGHCEVHPLIQNGATGHAQAPCARQPDVDGFALDADPDRCVRPRSDLEHPSVGSGGVLEVLEPLHGEVTRPDGPVGTSGHGQVLVRAVERDTATVHGRHSADSSEEEDARDEDDRDPPLLLHAVRLPISSALPVGGSDAETRGDQREFGVGLHHRNAHMA